MIPPTRIPHPARTEQTARRSPEIRSTLTSTTWVEGQQPLADAVEFAGGESFPEVWWLTRNGSAVPRRDIRHVPSRTRILKRCLDVGVAFTLLIFLAPVMAIVALAVRWTSPGPIIFRQVRVGLNLRRPGVDRRQQAGSPPGLERRQPGRDRRTEFSYGRHFTIYKFRTMTVDAERHGAQFAVKGDARVTPLGRFLRRTRLDELPQLINVLRGEMSLVGPRPERPEFIQELSREIPDYLNRLGLKPGLTGVAQILNGYDNEIESFRRKVAFDLHYLQHCSVWNDCKILLRTIKTVCTGSGAL